MKAIITADFHINKDNRFNDIQETLSRMARLVDEMKPKPKWFIFLGDAYLNWRPTPMEMNLFHQAIYHYIGKGINTLVLVGNHDYPESEEYRGMHCFTELKFLGEDDLTVIDEPQILDLDEGKTVGLFIPHIPKVRIDESYDKTFCNILHKLEEEARMQYPKAKPVVFSHVYMNEAKLGAGDIVISGDRGVNSSTLKVNGIDLAFLGDIHKSQRIEPGYYYPGSIERVDFGEREDIKGYIVYDNIGDGVEFVDLNSRPMVDIVLDLVNPGLVTSGQAKLPMDINTPPMEYIKEALTAKNDGGVLKAAIIRIKIICTKEQKAQLDGADETLAKFLIDDIGAHNLKSISYEIVDSQVVRDETMNESLDPKAALSKWVGMQEYVEQTQQTIVTAGKKIIEG